MDRIPIIIVSAVLILVFLVWLRWPLDYWNISRIKKACREEGLSDVEIKVWPGHYGVRAKKNGAAIYRKAGVWGTKVSWEEPKKKPNQPPEPMPLKRHGSS